jgi:hypothetical protein
MDIDVLLEPKARTYQFENVIFKGVLPNSIISDKICAIYSNKILCRAKDLLDLYALAHCVGVNTTEIHKILDNKKQITDPFLGFLSKQTELKHAYDKLK